MKTPRLAIALLAAVWIAAGCAVGPNYQPPKTAAPAAFANGAQAGFTTNEPVAAWWRSFHDDELNQLVGLGRVQQSRSSHRHGKFAAGAGVAAGRQGGFLPGGQRRGQLQQQ